MAIRAERSMWARGLRGGGGVRMLICIMLVAMHWGESRPDMHAHHAPRLSPSLRFPALLRNVGGRGRHACAGGGQEACPEARPVLLPLGVLRLKGGDGDRDERRGGGALHAFLQGTQEIAQEPKLARTRHPVPGQRVIAPKPAGQPWLPQQRLPPYGQQPDQRVQQGLRQLGAEAVGHGSGSQANGQRAGAPSGFGSMRVVIPNGVMPGQYIEVVIPGKGPTLVQVPPNTASGQQLEVRYPLPAAANPAAAPRGHMRSVSVVVPPGVLPGQQLEVRVEQGCMLVTVPEGAQSGQQLDVRYWVPEPGVQAFMHPSQQRTAAYGGRWGSSQPAHSHQGRGRPAGSTTPRPQVVRPPELPRHPAQLTKRLVLGRDSKHVAITLAAQYNVSLYIVNSDSLEFANSVKQRSGVRGRQFSDPVMSMVWQLCSQVPTRALVLLDIFNETMSARISRAMQYQGRHMARPECSWEEIDARQVLANHTKLTPSGQEPMWRFNNGSWGWCDPITKDDVDSVELRNSTVRCFLPSPPQDFAWVRATSDSWIAVNVGEAEGPPPTAVQLHRMHVREQLLHEVEERRLAREARRALLHVSADLSSNATYCLSELEGSAHPNSTKLARAISGHPRLERCFFGNGWNSVFRRFDAEPEANRSAEAIREMLAQADAMDDSEDAADVGVGRRGWPDRHQVNKMTADLWAAMEDGDRGVYEQSATLLEDEYRAKIQMKKDEERRRRQASFSLEITDSKRRSIVRQDDAYLSPHDYIRAVGGRTQQPRMRSSWRAVSLAAVIKLNATSPATAVSKATMLEWIRSEKPGMFDDMPDYVGMQLTGLCRDGTLRSHRPPPPPGGSGARGRREYQYYAAEGAASLLPPFDQIWPKLRASRHASMGHAGDAHDKQKRHHRVLSTQVVWKGKRARFVLNNWQDFSPFFEAENRDRGGPLASKLLAYEQAAMASMYYDEAARAGVRGQPDCIVGGTMRDYQVDGLRWLVRQHDLCVGSILGDEMGLGKTLQIVSFFGFLKFVRNEAGPYLVVAPLSVMNSWVNELARWCPKLKVITFHGSAAERERIRTEVLNREDFDICVTTYEMIVADVHGFVQRYVWSYVVMDEAHRVKNENSLLGQAVRKLKCNNRILITGTPLQNNLHELWSLLNLLFPEALATSAVFDAGFRIQSLYQGLEDVADTGAMERAHGLLQTLMMRRLKKDVLCSELPPKMETKIIVPLSEMQRFMYEGLLRRDLASCTKDGQVVRKLEYSRLSSLLMVLRKLCNHPYLLPEIDPMETDERMLEASSKLQVLDKLLTKIKSEGRKTLIYSQFTSMLDLIGDFLAYRGHKFLRLDGSTPAARRRFEIARFENPKSDYFVYAISTRAGGLGITLVAADTVILFDSDWNPSADLQAMDRVHRIGQKRAVNCYRLVTQGTVEQRIVAAAQQKTIMNAMVLQDEVAASTSGSKEDGKLGMNDLLKTIVEGSRCLNVDPGGLNVSSMDIEEILERAETVVTNLSSQAAQANDLQEIGRNADVSRDSEFGSAKEGERGTSRQESQVRGTLDAQSDTAPAQEEDEKDMLSNLFSALPGMHEFEGTDYSRKDTFRDLADQWSETHSGTKRTSEKRVEQVAGQSVLTWSLNNGKPSKAGSGKSRRKHPIRHKRWCQRCKRHTGTMLFCTRCPVVMHKFCVQVEGHEFDDDEDDREEDYESESEVIEGGQAQEDAVNAVSPQSSSVRGLSAMGQTSMGQVASGSMSGIDYKSLDKNAFPQVLAGSAPADNRVQSHGQSQRRSRSASSGGAINGTSHLRTYASRHTHHRLNNSMPEQDEQLCSLILARLLSRSYGNRFSRPVDATAPGFENYSSVVKRPMDLGAVHRKLREGSYPTVPHFADDIRLVGSNAMKYFPKESKPYKAGRILRKAFGDICQELGLKTQHAPCVGDWPHDYTLLLKRLVKNRNADAFLHPVDPERDGCPDYAKVISDPMDLATVLDRLEEGFYTNAEQMGADVRLTFENAMMYNHEKHPVHTAAKRVLRLFEERFGKLQQPLDKVPEEEQSVPIRKSAAWVCPHHRCVVTKRPASDCGGLLFRCVTCPRAFSDDCLEDGFEPVDVQGTFERLDYTPPTSAEYILCASCVQRNPNASLTPPQEVPCEDEESSSSEDREIDEDEDDGPDVVEDSSHENEEDDEEEDGDSTDGAGSNFESAQDLETESTGDATSTEDSNAPRKPQRKTASMRRLRKSLFGSTRAKKAAGHAQSAKVQGGRTAGQKTGRSPLKRKAPLEQPKSTRKEKVQSMTSPSGTSTNALALKSPTNKKRRIEKNEQTPPSKRQARAGISPRGTSATPTPKSKMRTPAKTAEFSRSASKVSKAEVVRASNSRTTPPTTSKGDARSTQTQASPANSKVSSKEAAEVVQREGDSTDSPLRRSPRLAAQLRG